MRSFARVVPALLMAVIVAAPVAAQSANARQVYTEALKREAELRRELDAHQASDPVAPLLQRIRTLVGAYSDMARLFPNNDQGDQAIWQGAMLSADTFWRFGDEIDRATALNLLDALRTRFPASPLTAQASPHVRRLSDAPLLAPVPGFGEPAPGGLAGATLPATSEPASTTPAPPAFEPAPPAVVPPLPEASRAEAAPAPARGPGAPPAFEPRASSTPRSTAPPPPPSAARGGPVTSTPAEAEDGSAPAIAPSAITATLLEPVPQGEAAVIQPAPPSASTTGTLASPGPGPAATVGTVPAPALPSSGSASPPSPPVVATTPPPAPAPSVPTPAPVPPAAAPPVPIGPAHLTGISGEALGEAIRFTLEVEREVVVRHEQFGGPPRIVIDLQDTVPADTLTQAWLPRGADVVSRIRVGRHDGTWTRVVIELRAPSRYSVFVVPDTPYRVLIEVHPRLTGLSTDAAIGAGAP
jgi:hypothetical protein